MIIALIIICICGLLLLITVYSISYYKNVSFNLKGADYNYKPKTAVFVPCKNDFKTLKDNLKSLLKQNYTGEYKVIFIIEDKNDPAYKTVNDIANNNPKTEIIIAGTALKTGQKNYNILKAIEKLDNEKRNDYEVYAFFDADHEAPINWLEELIITLTFDDTKISTFHSVKEPKGLFPLGNILYSMLHNYIYGVNTFSNQAWGGSLAMKKETYEKYKIEDIWKSSISHDCPINGAGAKVLFNPRCTPNETHYSYSLKSFLKWATRQFTNWKYYSLNFWCLSFFSILGNLLIIVGFVFLLLLSLFLNISNDVFKVLGIYIISSYFVLSLFISFKMKNFLLWTLFHMTMIPLFLAVLCLGFLLSINKKNIHWAGKKYSIGEKGVVLDIQNNIKN